MTPRISVRILYFWILETTLSQYLLNAPSVFDSRVHIRRYVHALQTQRAHFYSILRPLGPLQLYELVLALSYSCSPYSVETRDPPVTTQKCVFERGLQSGDA